MIYFDYEKIKRGYIMEYQLLLDLATELGYRLSMSGAETFRVEESITRVLRTYNIEAEVYAVTNCLIISIEPIPGQPMTRMRRIGNHGNNLDSVERFSALSRRICANAPEPAVAMEWLKETKTASTDVSFLKYLVGNLLVAFGFAIFFNGTLLDAVCAGVCGVLVGLLSHYLEKLHVNQFFNILFVSFILAFTAYTMGAVGIADNPDAIIIGTLMLLVPGIMFVNALRDIFFDDINSGVNRLTQVLLVAVALVLGAGPAWKLATVLWSEPTGNGLMNYSLLIQCIATLISCYGFAVIFHIRGFGGFLCALGGIPVWIVYAVSVRLGTTDILAFFIASLFAGLYAEIMARIRKFPAISYLIISVLPLIPGAGIYYTANAAVQGDMTAFAQKGLHTCAIAGAMAVGILLATMIFRVISINSAQRRQMSS